LFPLLFDRLSVVAKPSRSALPEFDTAADLFLTNPNAGLGPRNAHRRLPRRRRSAAGRAEDHARSFSVRPRLLRQNGNYNYQVRIEEGRAGAIARVIDATLRSMML
jgi:hypothetical protein